MKGKYCPEVGVGSGVGGGVKVNQTMPTQNLLFKAFLTWWSFPFTCHLNLSGFQHLCCGQFVYLEHKNLMLEAKDIYFRVE